MSRKNQQIVISFIFFAHSGSFLQMIYLAPYGIYIKDKLQEKGCIGAPDFVIEIEPEHDFDEL